jgi:hypothetical protein
MITRKRTIIDGYGRWELARREGRTTVTCIEYDLTEEEALHWLLYRHRRVEGLNAYCRILLALDLELRFRKQARVNQSAGGRIKGSSKLTEAETVDVRSEIAAAAGVSLGNVTKVKQVMTTACRELQDALQNAEVTIHRAWLWREMSSENQRRELMLYRGKRGVRKTIRRLISNHMSNNRVSDESLGLGSLARGLLKIQSPHLSSVAIAAVDVPGKAVFVTEELRWEPRYSLPPAKRNWFITHASPEPIQAAVIGPRCHGSATSGRPCRTFGMQVLPSLCPMSSGQFFSRTDISFTTYPHWKLRS